VSDRLESVLAGVRADLADEYLSIALAALDRVAFEHRDAAARSAATGAYFELSAFRDGREATDARP
jgi:hypothetical protein